MAANKVLTDQEGLGQTLGLGLHRVLKLEGPTASRRRAGA